MITFGIDIGSLTGKGVILKDDVIFASVIIRVKPTALESSKVISDELFKSSKLTFKDIDYICTTGYGRFEIPFSNMNISEISCHGMGAFWSDNEIKTIVDIGGQDCKVISVDEKGGVKDFMMNDKCAAGTGRSLEMLAKTIGVELEDLGKLSMKSRKPLNVTNKCSIFMELEVLDALYREKKKKHIANGISDAVAKRVASLAKNISIKNDVALTGGVAKNSGVVRQLEYRMNIKFKSLKVDPQLIGAIGAAIYAMKEVKKNNRKDK